MPEQTQITEDQHYVPRFYIKQFSLIKRKKKKDRGFASFYRLSDGLSKSSIPVESICYKKFFYGEDCVVEHQLSKKESVWAGVFHKLTNSCSQPLDDNDIRLLKEFAVYQYTRTDATLSHHKETFEKALTTSLENFSRVHQLDAPLDKELSHKIKDTIHNKVEAEATADVFVESCDSMIDILDFLDVGIVKFETSHKLIISDMPEIMSNPYYLYRAGINQLGTVIWFPASENILVVFYDKKVFPSLRPFTIVTDENDVVALNKYQILSAKDMIISEKVETLTDAVAQDAIISDCNQFINREKVYSQHTEDGTFFAVVGQGIPFIYPLSFLRLARELRNIPDDIRFPITTSYNADLRVSILCWIYGNGFYKENHQPLVTADKEKIRAIFKKLLCYVDFCWDTPKEKQVISPTMMTILKCSEVSVNISPPTKKEKI